MNNIYIKNPFNYIGSKDRLLSQIEPHLNFDCNYLIEPFCGSMSITINFGERFSYCYVNDSVWQLIETIMWFIKNSSEQVVETIEKNIDFFKLSKKNKDGYINLRNYYNQCCKDKNSFEPWHFYNLILHSYNHMIHINGNQEFNTPSGAGRSYFNPSIKKKLIKYIDKLHEICFVISSEPFEQFIDYISASFDGDLHNCLFFIDSPYLLTDSSYCRIHNNKWTETHERLLYNKLDEINENGGKFLLTNILTKDNKHNIMLEQFRKRYKTIYLNNDYRNCNHQKENKKEVEIIVKNY